MELLEERFGKKERIVFAHIQALLNVTTVPGKGTKTASLWKLQDELLSHICSLEIWESKAINMAYF